MKDKKFIKKSDIPEDILARLELGKDTPDEAESLNSNTKRCIFCHMGGCRYTKLIDGQVVYLCENDYYDKNMGHVAQRVRELKGVTNG